MRRRGLTLLELVVVLTILVSLATLVVPIISNLGSKSQQVATRENLARLQDLLVNRYQVDMGELPRPSAATVAAGTRPNHPQLRYLFVNPDTEDAMATAGTTLLSGRVWRGPYVTHRGWRLPSLTDASTPPVTRPFYRYVSVSDAKLYGILDPVGAGPATALGDPTIVDAWGHPIVLQEPTADKTYARLVSAGPDGVLDTDPTVLMPDNSLRTAGSTDTFVGRNDDILFFLYRADQFGDGNAYLNLAD